MAKAYYHSLPTVLCKILGVYTIRYDNRETGKKAIENVVVMENIFYQVNNPFGNSVCVVCVLCFHANVCMYISIYLLVWQGC